MKVSSMVRLARCSAVLCVCWLSGVHAADLTSSEGREIASTVPSSAAVVARGNEGSISDVGAATTELLALQRAEPATRPRMIDGAQASRSYARYLKSFEHPIPEVFNMNTNTSTKK